MKKIMFLINLLVYAFAGKTFAEDVARVGDATYASLAAAVNAVPSGGTVTMIANTEVTSGTISVGKIFTLDLNGKTVTGNFPGSYATVFDIQRTNGNLTIEDSSEEQSGKITCVDNGQYIILISVHGKFTMNGGTIISPSNPSNGCCVVNVAEAEAVLVVNGGVITSSKGRSNSIYGVINNLGTATINGGSIINTYSVSGMESRAIQNNSVLYAYSGSVKSSNEYALYSGPKGTVFMGSGLMMEGSVFIKNPINEYVLTDNADFSLPTDLSVNKITYNRGNSNAFGTVCLPFVPDSKATITYYTLKEADENTLTLETVNNVEANTPYVYYTEDGTFNVSRETVTTLSAGVTAGSVTSSNGWTLKGIYAHTTVYEAVEPNSYYIKNNAFCKVNGNFNIKPLRAYFTAPSGANSGRYEISVIDEATALSNLIDEGLSVRSIRDVNGMRHSKLQRGVNLVTMSNGITKKVIVK
ncbi:MAG: hypothetical protein IJ832_00985 [Bacteroidaceae bacterium]|nr:hypothetical protein [Bacteroidaceae bacterium]